MLASLRRPGPLRLAILLAAGLPVALAAEPIHSPGKLYEATAAQDATVTGKILDPEGQPVPGAELALTTSQDSRPSPGLSLTGQSAGKAVSDPTGSFAIAHLGAGRFDLRVRSRGFVT